MKKFFLLGAFLSTLLVSFSQAANQKIATAFQKFENDAQLKAAFSSLYVVNAKTGAVVFNKNSTIGISPGSTQKLITTAAAYELLGRDFRYKTEFGVVENGNENNLY